MNNSITTTCTLQYLTKDCKYQLSSFIYLLTVYEHTYYTKLMSLCSPLENKVHVFYLTQSLLFFLCVTVHCHYNEVLGTKPISLLK